MTKNIREITYAKAISEVLDQEMEIDDNIVILGEDVGFLGGNFKTTEGLFEKYGDLRVKDTPISEAGFVGMGVGAAITGLRPVVELMFCDFIAVAMDQIVNQAAKIRYMSGGQVKVPLTIRTPMGGGRSSAAQHSQSLQAWLVHIPGLKVVMPSTATEAQGLLKTAIRDDNPVIFLEHKMEYNNIYKVEENVEPIPFGKANIVKEGNDLTIVATSNLVNKSKEVAEELESKGYSIEVIDLRTIVPMDTETIVESVKKTGKLLVCDEGHLRGGIHNEVAQAIMKDVFYYLDYPVEKIGTDNVPLPFSPALEFDVIPSKEKISEKSKEMIGG